MALDFYNRKSPYSKPQLRLPSTTKTPLSLTGNRTMTDVDNSARFAVGSADATDGVKTFPIDTTIPKAQFGAKSTGLRANNTRTGYSGIDNGNPPVESNNVSEGVQFGVKIAAGIASSVIDQYATDKAYSAQQKMNKNLEAYKNKGKYWFDPSLDITPTLDQYLDGYPSAERALQDSQIIGGKDAEVAGNFLDPGNSLVGWATGTDQKKMRYAQNKELQGAIKGFSQGGWIGAIAGGVIGLIEGFFGYGDAQKADAETRERMRQEYKQKFDDWRRAKIQQSNERQRMTYSEQAQNDNLKLAKKKTVEEQNKLQKDKHWNDMLNMFSTKSRQTRTPNPTIRL